MRLAIASLVLVCAASASAQKLDVKIIDRQDRDLSWAVHLLLYPHPAPAKDKHKVPMAPLPAQIAKVQVAGTL